MRRNGMKIEVWYDFVCPLCYIGKRRLEIALDKFKYEDEVELVFKSFEIGAFSEKKCNDNMNEITAKKYRITLEEAKASNNYIVEKAKAVGLYFNFDELIPKNTFDAHRVLHYAKAENKMEEMAERIFKAHFVDSLNISNYIVLASLAGEVGLNSEIVISILESDQYSEEVTNDEETALRLGIEGVPYYIINNKYVVPGAQPPELFLEILEKARKDEISTASQSIIDELLGRIL
jgi:predicted DsbA family dithiol-disulfide isomerase